MLNLIGTIGDQVQLTFVKGPNGLIAQERIDRRTVIPLKPRGWIRPGDKCLATIRWESTDKRALYVQVERVIERGDGRSSSLEKVLEPIGWASGSTTVDEVGTIMAMDIAREQFGKSDLTLLEGWIHVLELCARDRTKGTGLDYAAVIPLVEGLAEKCFAEDADRKVATQLLIVRHCMHRSELRAPLSLLLCKCADHCDRVGPHVQEYVGRTIDQFGGDTASRVF